MSRSTHAGAVVFRPMPRDPATSSSRPPKARPLDLCKGHIETGRPPETRCRLTEEAGVRAADPAPCARRAERRKIDLHSVFPHGPCRPRGAARKPADPLAFLRRSDGGARHGKEPAPAALGGSPGLDEEGVALASHAPHRHPPRRATRAASPRAPAPRASSVTLQETSPPMIKTQARERIATIELARPEKKNALTAAMYAAMTESLATESDPGVR